MYSSAGWCSRTAASMAGPSSSKSGVSGTPTNFSPCSLAAISYITKPGRGAMTTLPGTSAASVSRLISSSEPLPSMMSQSPGMFGAQHVAPLGGIAVERDLGQALAQLLAQRRGQAERVLHRVHLDEAGAG